MIIAAVVAIAAMFVLKRSKGGDGVVVVSGGEKIVDKNIDVEKLKKPQTAESAQKLYFYYKFAEQDERMVEKWLEIRDRRAGEMDPRASQSL